MIKLTTDRYSFIKSYDMNEVIDFIESEPLEKTLFIGQDYELYGNAFRHGGFPEDHPLYPKSIQTLVQSLFGEVVDFYRRDGRKIYLVRVFELFNEELAPKTLTDSFVINNYTIEIPETDVYYDYIHTSDFEDALTLIEYNQPKDIIFNIGSGTSISHYDLALEMGYKYEIKRNPNLPTLPILRSKARIKKLQHFGFWPKYSILEWIKSNR